MRQFVKVGSIIECVLIVVVIAIAGCGKKNDASQVSTEQFTTRADLTGFVSNGVSVKVALETDSKNHPVLSATFAPTKQGFHLYSKDLPERGVNGIGVPTRFVVINSENVKSSGSAFANVSPKNLEMKSLGVTLPIYPEGPVQIRIPIEVSPTATEAEAKLSFTYMACKSDGECLRPVEGKELTVKIPKLQAAVGAQ